MAGCLAVKSRLALAIGLGAALASGAPASELVIARDGKAKLHIVLPRDATEVERTAAEELAHYLKRTTGGRFRIKAERPNKRSKRAIYVGATAFVSSLEWPQEGFADEAWSIREHQGSLVLTGGERRGTLYAVYRFLEDDVGVRWWTPWDESVPWRRDLVWQPRDRTGRPAFVYRDIYGTVGPRGFWARNRVNGHFTYLSARFGGREAYGPPDQVHNLFRYVPPEEYFAEHPDFYSELDGERDHERAQLCFSNEQLATLVGEKLRGYIEQARAASERDGEEPPRLFAISQNDVGGACGCARCLEIAEREGARSGTLVTFINRVAASVAADYPDILVDTLAYGFTLEPPQHASYASNVSVRLAALYNRDFAKPITDPTHRWYREAIDGWSRRTEHLRIWDYVVTFGREANLPLPNLPLVAIDLSYYLDHGVEGVFVQQNLPVLADMRDLKLWVLTKLIEDPRRELGPLIHDFTDGYYGAAGEEIRRYLDMLAQAMARRPATLNYPPALSDYGYLTTEILFRAQELFDRAERRAGEDTVLLRRIRRSRFSLDRATVLLWEDRFGDDAWARDESGREMGLRRVAERARDTAHATIEERIPESQRGAERRRIDRELGRVIAPYMDREEALASPDHDR
jgi:hypothetical protein